MTTVLDVAGRRVLVVGDDHPTVRDARGVLALIGEGMAADAGTIAVPVDNLAPSFFHLRSGFAGEVLQKLATYRFTLAVLGDISAHTAASAAFRDFVREANRGSAVLFVDGLTAIVDR